ncbi:lipoprotein insertase outer membrane protein LolB [Undibacterium sp.]|uniref:lipoprotein insertase outer membrane protein LolB n=1 Tax=Undibacterium sp. TaxID=1914977 RepID=UPI0025F4360C|nr:lipoprotein insertase outer membrane protein LolB [Undibacterium sp.]
MNIAQLRHKSGYSRFLSFSLSISLGLLLSACATPSGMPRATESNQAAQPQTRHYREQINLSGRIHVQYQHNDKAQSLPGSFEWSQDHEKLHINLLNPLGQTIASIEQDAHGARLQQANQSMRSAANLDELLDEALGWPLPVAGLKDWLQGYSRDARQTPSALPPQDNLMLTADGWQLRYVTWIQETGEIRPKRLDLQRYTPQAGAVSLKIIIDQWNTP